MSRSCQIFFIFHQMHMIICMKKKTGNSRYVNERIHHRDMWFTRDMRIKFQKITKAIFFGVFFQWMMRKKSENISNFPDIERISRICRLTSGCKYFLIQPNCRKHTNGQNWRLFYSRFVNAHTFNIFNAILITKNSIMRIFSNIFLVHCSLSNTHNSAFNFPSSPHIHSPIFNYTAQ